MPIKLIVRGFTMGAVALLMAALATPAMAQGAQGAIKGRVLDGKNHPAPGVLVSVSCTSVANVQPRSVTTDSDGRFQFTGLVFGKWTLSAQQGNQVAKPKEAFLNVLSSVVTDVGDIALKVDKTAAPVKNAGASKGPTPEEAKEHNRRLAEVQTKFKEANDDIEAGRLDDALIKLQAVAKDMKDCAACSAKLGEVYQKKDDLASAEKYFLEAISFDPATLDAYKSLASVYNSQQKFDDAMKMNAKVTELTAATGGNNDPTSVYNEGVVLWNAGKFVEAEAAFKKASELDPKKAIAFYQLGMTQVNLGKIPEAVKSLEAFLALSPKGPEVDQAKAMLLAIKK
jgi:tetratricopeptide (TPR) repeat protein